MSRASHRLLQQKAAADPRLSVWVEANAGSGKTMVLVDRIVRLLLDGVAPSRLLCLTYTRAAAAEMRTRLLRVLGRWVLLDEAALGQELQALTGLAADATSLSQARRLMADVLATPGGLKIQTIHAFCEALLKRFPLEAGVAPGSQVLDEAGADALLDEALRDSFTLAAGDPQSPLGQAIAALATRLYDDNLSQLVKLVVKKPEIWKQPGQRGPAATDLLERLDALLGLDASDTEETVTARAVDLLRQLNLKRLADALSAAGVKLQKHGHELATVLAKGEPAAIWQALLNWFITTKGTERQDLLDAKARKFDSGAADLVEVLAPRLRRISAHVKAAAVADRTRPLLVVAAHVRGAYEAAKAAQAKLDYDGLIQHVEVLLTRAAGAAWVLFKLDGGIDHILVDEAQDTSPQQWAILGALMEEFFAGLGADGPPRAKRPRTVFAVGDPKQSIFSFQGAEPRAFGEMAHTTEMRAQGGGAEFLTVPLNTSFRSAPPVLRLTDAVFKEGPARDGVVAPGGSLLHIAHREHDAGSIEFWPVFEQDKGSEDGLAWDAPFDYPKESSALERLALELASTIAEWLKGKERLASQDRPIEPGDILILLRKRGGLANALIRQLKRRGIPVAGADRLKLTDHIAIEDMLALAQVALTPADDLTLACALKGPWLALSEDNLFTLAHARPGRLIDALRARAHEPAFQAAWVRVEFLLSSADQVPPFDFFARLLGEEGVRQSIAGRLGPDAQDPLDELLNLALAYEREHAPSLQGFVHWLKAGEVEIKRDMDQGQGQVRVMTVHGAKGLEANIVILPDTCQVGGTRRQSVFLHDGVPLAAGPSGSDDPVTATARQAHMEREREENNRLLYVALTRARDRLIVCGYSQKKSPPAGNWYDLILKGLTSLSPEQVERPIGTVLTLRSEQTRKVSVKPEAAAMAATPLPHWIRTPAPLEPMAQPLTPSGPSRQATAETQRGALIHALLAKALQAGTRTMSALETLGRSLEADPGLVQDAVAEVFAIVEQPSIMAAFVPGIRAEVAFDIFEARLGRRISGRFDYLSVSRDQVRIIDVKTGRAPTHSDRPAFTAYGRQMALYHLAAAQLFPGIPVEAGILWTAHPALEWLPSRLLQEFVPLLDPPGGTP